MEIYIPKTTKPRKYITKSGESKQYEYLQIEGVPCKVIKNKNGNIILNSLVSTKTRRFSVSKDVIKNDFIKGSVNKKGFITNATKYPIPLNISEFTYRNKFDDFKKKIINIIKTLPTKLKKTFNEKFFQLLVSQGCTKTITISKYHKFKNKTLKIGKTQTIGDPIFNRNSRWCPPVEMSYDEFKNSPSYPLPIGIRKKDFCLPSELLETVTELVSQLISFKNSNLTDKQKLEFEKLGIKQVKIHVCKFCGKELDINLCSSKYSSQTNYMEICHRDPNERFIKKNMYWGHGICNRKQGGFTEEENIISGLRLLLLNPDICKNPEVAKLLKKIKPQVVEDL